MPCMGRKKKLEESQCPDVSLSRPSRFLVMLVLARLSSSPLAIALLNTLHEYYRPEETVLAGRELRSHGDGAVVKRRRLKPNQTTSFFYLFSIQHAIVSCARTTATR